MRYFFSTAAFENDGNDQSISAKSVYQFPRVLYPSLRRIITIARVLEAIKSMNDAAASGVASCLAGKSETKPIVPHRRWRR